MCQEKDCELDNFTATLRGGTTLNELSGNVTKNAYLFFTPFSESFQPVRVKIVRNNVYQNVTLTDSARMPTFLKIKLLNSTLFFIKRYFVVLFLYYVHA